MLTKIPWDKINGIKNVLFYSFERSNSTQRSFTFNLRFLYELKHKVRRAKSVCRIFHFRFHFVFKVYFSCSTKCLWPL